MPKQTARKCTGGGFAPYLLARAKRAAAAGLPVNPSDQQDGGDQDDASRDLSVSSAGMEDMKLFSLDELQSKTKEELIQIVVRLQESIQDIIADEDDDEEDFDAAGGADEDEDEDDEEFEDGVIQREDAAVSDRDVVELDDEDEDDDVDDEDDDVVNGQLENGDLSPDEGPDEAAAANNESKD